MNKVKILLLIGLVFNFSIGDEVANTIDGTSVAEWRGYFKREHSLIRPYQGAFSH